MNTNNPSPKYPNLYDNVYDVDEENLAEGGVKEFLETIKPTLESEKVLLETLGEDYSDKGYKIVINGIEYQIYSEEDVNSEGLWTKTLEKVVSILNQLLKKAGSDKKARINYGGVSDCQIIFD